MESSFKFFPVFQFGLKIPPPGVEENGQNIYPCIGKVLLFSFHINLLGSLAEPPLSGRSESLNLAPGRQWRRASWPPRQSRNRPRPRR